MALELLSKLNPKTAKLETVGYGKGLLAWDDIAGALAGLPQECAWYAYALLETTSNDKRGMPNKYTDLLVHHLTVKVWSKIREDNFKPRSMQQGVMAMGIARAVVHCALNAKGACSRCSGSGMALRDGKMQDCIWCDGNGVAEFSYSDRYAVGFNAGKKGDKNNRKWYQHHCASYDYYATRLIADIISKVKERIRYVIGNAKGWDGYGD